MIRQILSRSFVLQQLRRVRAHLENVLSQDTTRQSFLSNFPGVAPEHLRMTLEAIQQAQTLAYVDVLYLLAWTTALMVPLAFLMKRARPGAAMGH